MEAAGNAGAKTAGRGGLLRNQIERLRELVEVVRAGNQFYSPRLEPFVGSSASPSLAAFRGLCPFTTKEELVADSLAHPPYGTNLTYPIGRYSRFHQTSGTTGAPLRWLDDSESWSAMVDDWVTVFRAAGVQPSDRVCFTFSFGPFLGFWLAFEAAARLGCLCIPGGGLGSGARVRLLRDNAVTVLCCTPTYAARLGAEAERDRSGGPLLVRLIIVAGEPGGSIPERKAELSAQWGGARVFDHHGMTEVGPVTYECPVRPGVLHVMESSFVAEVINPGAEFPTPAGSVGELVLTPLGRRGMPLFRYRTGDLVRPTLDPADATAADCPCGTAELGLEGGILGRADDMRIIRGVNVYPAAVDAIIGGVPGVAAYEARFETVEGTAELCLTIEPANDAGPPELLLAAVVAAFRDRLGLRVRTALAPDIGLPRDEMKARKWVRPH